MGRNAEIIQVPRIPAPFSNLYTVLNTGAHHKSAALLRFFLVFASSSAARLLLSTQKSQHSSSVYHPPSFIYNRRLLWYQVSRSCANPALPERDEVSVGAEASNVDERKDRRALCVHKLFLDCFPVVGDRARELSSE
ncbi:Hypothetical protein NTJ_03315 [Nesidiocoris tenuis]|uniref:Uncharacterized protein n=1 Tax=Nesidiocoris tenuis TaxID=355587 RepID=A0ABN7ADZ4_9HEMI|nr:Hypothetical protein NTJ_03315 [Nesidiocoris tenuis]